jgi:hypothetical protein
MRNPNEQVELAEMDPPESAIVLVPGSTCIVPPQTGWSEARTTPTPAGSIWLKAMLLITTGLVELLTSIYNAVPPLSGTEEAGSKCRVIIGPAVMVPPMFPGVTAAAAPGATAIRLVASRATAMTRRFT